MYAGGVLQRTYNWRQKGTLAAIHYAAGVDASFAYTGAGARVRKTDASGARSYRRDGDGVLSAVLGDDAGSAAWSVDREGKVLAFTRNGDTISYAYNDAAQRTAMVEPGNRSWSYGYDSAGRLATFTNPESETTTYQFEPTTGRVLSKETANDVVETYGYDARSRLNSVVVRDAQSALLRSTGYVYDDSSRMTSETIDGTLTTNYGYDLAGRLTSESRPGYSAAYTYDSAGNRLSRTVNGVTTSYSYDEDNRLMGSTKPQEQRTYWYDEAGRISVVFINNVIGRRYNWNADGTLGLTEVAQAPNVSYTYDASGARATKAVQGGAANTYRRDGFGVTSPILGDGAATYTPGVSERRGGVSTFSHSGLKNMGAQTSALGAVTATKRYDAFGSPVATTGTWQGPSGYGGGFGYQTDAEHGLMQLGHRYYDPDLGRFISPDPAMDGTNWWAYCDNNPLTFIDPSGLSVTGDKISDQAKAEAGKGPKDCGRWLRLVLSEAGVVAPSGQASTWDDWFAEHPKQWRKVENTKGSVLQPGDIIVTDRTGNRPHGHVQVVTNDGIFSASLGSRSGENQGKRIPPFKDAHGEVTIWRPIDPEGARR